MHIDGRRFPEVAKRVVHVAQLRRNQGMHPLAERAAMRAALGIELEVCQPCRSITLVRQHREQSDNISLLDYLRSLHPFASEHNVEWHCVAGILRQIDVLEFEEAGELLEQSALRIEVDEQRVRNLRPVLQLGV